MSDRIIRGRNAIFGHVARLPVNTPAHQAMLRQVELSVGRPPDPSWKRPPGRPRTTWTDQLCCYNNNVPTATLWRQAIGRGHSRATLQSEPTKRKRQRRQVTAGYNSLESTHLSVNLSDNSTYTKSMTGSFDAKSTFQLSKLGHFILRWDQVSSFSLKTSVSEKDSDPLTLNFFFSLFSCLCIATSPSWR